MKFPYPGKNPSVLDQANWLVPCVYLRWLPLSTWASSFRQRRGFLTKSFVCLCVFQWEAEHPKLSPSHCITPTPTSDHATTESSTWGRREWDRRKISPLLGPQPLTASHGLQRWRADSKGSCWEVRRWHGVESWMGLQGHTTSRQMTSEFTLHTWSLSLMKSACDYPGLFIYIYTPPLPIRVN